MKNDDNIISLERAFCKIMADKAAEYLVEKFLLTHRLIHILKSVKEKKESIL